MTKNNKKAQYYLEEKDVWKALAAVGIPYMVMWIIAMLVASTTVNVAKRVTKLISIVPWLFTLLAILLWATVITLSTKLVKLLRRGRESEEDE